MLKTIVLILLAMMTGAGFGAQSDADRDAEAKQADAEEEEARKKNPDMMYTEYSGKLTLYSKEQRDQEQDGGAVGTFKTAKDTHLVKLESAKTLEDMKGFDGKQCTLKGKIRNAGKYIVVKEVVLSGAENQFKRRRGGL